MARPRNAPLRLRPGDRARLERIAARSDERDSMAHRARAILALADGHGQSGAARESWIGVGTLRDWRLRYEREGIAGLESARVAEGRSRTDDDLRILWATLRPPPAAVGRRRGRWAADSLAEHLGVPARIVYHTWHEHGLHPTGIRSYRFCTRPELSGQIVDVLGVRIAPPRSVAVLQVVDDDGDVAPPTPETSVMDTVSSGLQEALQRAEDQDREGDLLGFLDDVVAAYPDKDLRVVLERWSNLADPQVREWFAAHPRVRVHTAPDAGGRLSPRYGCWRTMVLAWFAIGERRRPRHGRIDVARRFADRMRAAVLGWRSATVSYTWIRAVDGPS